MSIRFIHTADWQFGMKAAHVAAAAEAVRRARFETLARVVRLAAEERVEFLLIAGDLFEDNGVGNDVVHQVVRNLEESPVPVYILPGNHDLIGAGSVYERPAFRHAGPNVHVLRDTEPVLLPGGAALLPAPVRQKHSESDPTTRFAQVDAAIRIGVAHGSPRIEGMYKRDDHPIALDAARRLGLNYLALGHWHSWIALDERTVMPGTPEPTGFGESSGYAALVTVTGPGAPPTIEQRSVRTLHWAELECDAAMTPKELRERVRAWFGSLAEPGKHLVRVRLTGPLTAEVEAAAREEEEWMAARALYAHVDTSGTWPAVSEGRLREIAAAHPFVAGLLTDLSQLAAAAGAGEQPGLAFAAAGEGGSGGFPPVEPLPRSELLALLRESGIDLDAETIMEAVRVLGRHAGEVWE